MTALATVPDHAPAIPTQQAPTDVSMPVEYLQMDPTGGRLVAWASALQAASQLGAVLCRTAFAPMHFRNKPEDTTVAILYGDELGLTPAQSIRSVFVIGGTPSLYARTMVAIVLSKGHEMWTEKKTDSEVTVCGRRRGSSVIERETWTTARANRAGYTSNKKYTTDPQAMLYARAAADVARRIAPDALSGIAYTVEEMELTETPTVTVAPPESSSSGKRKVSTRKAQPAPDLDGAKPAEPAAPVMSSPEQHAQLVVALDQSEHKSTRQRQAFIAETLGRSITDPAEMTADEVQRVITALTQPAEAVPVEDPEDYAPSTPQGEDPWAQGGESR